MAPSNSAPKPAPAPKSAPRLGGKSESRAARRGGAWASLLVSLCSLVGCRSSEASEDGVEPVEAPIPASSLGVPADFTGPIDPDWPPSDPATHHVELEAARLYRELYRLGKKPPRGDSLLVGSSPHLFAEEGRIGDFDYLEVIVGDIRNPDAAMPLVVLLHGRGGKPSIPRRLLGGKSPIRLFLPRAPDRLGEGYTWLAARTLDHQEQLLGRSLAGRVDQLMPAIEAFAKLRPTRGRPLVVGFSQGGILAYALGLRYPRFFGAVYPIAAWVPDEFVPERLPERSPPFFARHGGADDIVPAALGRATAKRLRARGFEIHYLEEPGVGHVVTDSMTEGVQRDIYQYLFSGHDLRR